MTSSAPILTAHELEQELVEVRRMYEKKLAELQQDLEEVTGERDRARKAEKETEEELASHQDAITFVEQITFAFGHEYPTMAARHKLKSPRDPVDTLGLLLWRARLGPLQWNGETVAECLSELDHLTARLEMPR